MTFDKIFNFSIVKHMSQPVCLNVYVYAEYVYAE